MRDISKMGMHQEASITSDKVVNASIGMLSTYHVECFDTYGKKKWEETIKNLVTTEGLNYILDSGFDSGTQITTWYVGLKDTGAPAATDDAATLGASPQAWTEYTEYDEAVRQTLTLGTVSGGSIDNSGNVASFTIGSPAPDVYGVFLVDDNTKGGQSPATVLYGVGDFAAAKVVDPDDTLNVTVTLTATSA
jgi:hypothetical protein